HLNRAQNTNDILLADATTGNVKPLFQDKDEAWVDAIYGFQWINDGKEFLFPSERSGWRHYYRVSRETGASREITRGDFDAISGVGVNEKEGWLYFIASPENATQRYLYRAKLDGSGTAERVTPVNAAGTHAYDVSPDGRWAFHTFDTFDSPPDVDLVRLPTHRSERALVSNAELRAKTAPFVEATPKEFLKVDVGEGVSLDGFMIRPKNFDSAKKYPVFVYIYGEPAGQTVLNAWSEHNLAFLRAAAAGGYIVVGLDNRGTAAPKGRAWRKQVHGAIHPVIVKDQTAALKALMRARPYLDATRVAVHGWSGGGSSTLSLMFRSPDLYKVGMAGAPVPELRLYDTIYQERYMGLPLEKVEGYKTKSAV